MSLKGPCTESLVCGLSVQEKLWSHQDVGPSGGSRVTEGLAPEGDIRSPELLYFLTAVR